MIDKGVVAIHEAGHAVAAVLLGMPFRRVHIFEHDGDWTGEVEFIETCEGLLEDTIPVASESERARVRNWIRVLLAGPYSVDKLARRDNMGRGGGGNDLVRVVRMLERLSGDDEEAYFETLCSAIGWCRYTTHDRFCWAAVNTISGALLADLEVKQEEAKRACARCPHRIDLAACRSLRPNLEDAVQEIRRLMGSPGDVSAEMKQRGEG